MDDAAKLEERIVDRRALHADQVRCQVERGQLVRVQFGDSVLVVRPVDPIALDGWVGTRHRLDDQWQTESPKFILVPLKGAPERFVVV